MIRPSRLVSLGPRPTAALLALGLLAGCQDQPANLGPDAPALPQGGGSAAEMGPGFCESAPPTDPTLANEWNHMCMPGR
ncbi:MAG: hypothetical protein DI556_16410 [Rhodovulum sulfidophilum]|uniref:Lipoprotein n=1 Tax=Rhodovulum sulfidophilum TaxID=35806 RepID=A0A2W5N3X7_RHOSU|nr:MAG: hypothetical protein DI556_16410 [Rhodovulum sulfidophilum]